MIRHHSTLRHVLLCLALGSAMCAMQSSVFAAESTSSQETILFLGDSITAAGGYVRAIDAGLRKLNPENPYRIINGGKSSETVSGLSEAYHPGVRPCLFSRLKRELERAKPDWVVACYGINDGIYHPYDDSRFEAYKAGIKRLIKEVHAFGSHIILLTSSPYAKAGPAFPEGTDAVTRKKLLAEANNQANAEAVKDPYKYGYRTPYAYYDQVMATYAAWLLTLNNQEDVWVIDLRKAMLPKIKETHEKGPVHPTKLGHDLMAAIFLKQWPSIKKEAASYKKKNEPSPAGDVLTASYGKGDDFSHEPSNQKDVEAKHSVKQRYRDYDLSSFSPEQQEWEKLLIRNLGKFYWPRYIKAKKAGEETAWDYVKDVAGLPRMLIIGDSISRGYTMPVRHALKGKVNVHRAPQNCSSTKLGVKKLGIWLGDGKWDLIVFNFGIHDLRFSETDYSARLAKIIKRLKATGAKLVWVSTTPVPKGASEYKGEGAVERLNKAAAELMKEANITVLDLNSAITPLIEKYQRPKNCHYYDEGYNFMGKVIADKVLAELKIMP